MFRDAVRTVPMLPRLGRPMAVMRDRLHRLAVFGLGPLVRVFRGRIKVVTHPITSENLRRYQSRTDVSAVVAQDETVDARFLRGPIFTRRNQDGPAINSLWSAKDKGMNSLAAEHLYERHLAGPFFHDDGGESAPGEG
jgi:hypothetical protein